MTYVIAVGQELEHPYLKQEEGCVIEYSDTNSFITYLMLNGVTDSELADFTKGPFDLSITVFDEALFFLFNYQSLNPLFPYNYNMTAANFPNDSTMQNYVNVEDFSLYRDLIENKSLGLKFTSVLIEAQTRVVKGIRIFTLGNENSLKLIKIMHQQYRTKFDVLAFSNLVQRIDATVSNEDIKQQAVISENYLRNKY